VNGGNDMEAVMETHKLTEHLRKVSENFPDGFGIWGYLYKKGHAGIVEPFTVEERKELREMARGFRCKIGFCYYNAQTIACQRGGGNSRVKYIEGLVTCHGVPIDHAWIEYNGKVFDPTLNDLRTFKDKQGLEREYYGMEIPKELIWKNQLDMKTYSPLTQWPSKFAEQLLKGEER
jgi:hypothetical protein